MTFVKGQSGNPGGKATDKMWRDALRKEGCNLVPDPNDPKREIKRIELVARQVYDDACNGDIAAAKEIGDRLDGKSDSNVNVRNSGTVTHEHRAVSDALAFLGTEETGAEKPDTPRPLPN